MIYNENVLFSSANSTSVMSVKAVYTGFFFISNTFISYAQLKLVKNQADAKQHPEAELQLFESYSHSSFMLLIKNKRRYSK